MIFSARSRNMLFKVFAILAVFIALYHLTGVFYKINDSPRWRHGLFVCINLFCIYCLLKRPKYFLFLFCILLVQQYYSHGSHLVKQWRTQHTIHWISVFALALLPVALVCLIEDYREKNKKSIS